MTIRYTNIQRFCLDDGPGIRTVLFLFGCNLRCPWCCNPENVHELPGFPVLEMEPEELAMELMRDCAYFGEDGGITLSGGEPLLQAEALVPLLQLLKAEGVHIVVETALFVEWAKIEAVLPYVDLFLVDAKVMDADGCRNLLGGDLGKYRENLNRLDASRTSLRMPLIEPSTTSEVNIASVVSLAKELKLGEVEFLPGHSLSSGKSKKTVDGAVAKYSIEFGGISNDLSNLEIFLRAKATASFDILAKGCFQDCERGEVAGLIIAETPFQLLSAIATALSLEIEFPLSSFDVAIYGSFPAAKLYANRLMEADLFNNIVYVDPYFGSMRMQGAKHYLRLLLNRRRNVIAFERNCPDLMGRSYSLLLMPTATPLPTDAKVLACGNDVQTYLFEEGVGSRNGDVGWAFALPDNITGGFSNARSSFDRAKYVFKRIAFSFCGSERCFNVKRFYFFNPNAEIEQLYRSVDVRPIDIESCLGSEVISQVFTTTGHDEYTAGAAVLLTAAYDAPKRVLDVEDEVVNGLKGLSNVVIRRHPRSKKNFSRISDSIIEDASSDLWEALWLSDLIDEDVILMGMGSSAQIYPHIMFGYEPVVVFLHRLNGMKLLSVERVFDELRNSYSNKERVLAPETMGELLSCISSVRNGLGMNR